MPRGDQLIRQWTIIRVLENSRFGLSVDDLVDQLSCSRRTVYRDLDVLSAVGFPIASETHLGKTYWKLGREFDRGPRVPFTPTELMALYFGRDLLAPLRGTFLSEGLDSALGKIRSTLTKEVVDYLSRLRSTFAVTQRGLADHRDLSRTVDEIVAAIGVRKKVKMVYKSLGRTEPREHVVHPYLLTFHAGALYLVAHSETHGEVRTFHLGRVLSSESVDESFKVSPSFSGEKWIRESFGVAHDGAPTEVRIHFNAEVAQLIRERTWHGSQEIEDQADGSILLTMKVSGLLEVKFWVLSFGARAKILAPPELVADVAAESKKLVEHVYREELEAGLGDGAAGATKTTRAPATKASPTGDDAGGAKRSTKRARKRSPKRSGKTS